MAEGDTPMDEWERTVVVEGFEPSVTTDIIELLFEDPNETGGGDIDEITMEEEGTATIVFAEKSVVDRVLNRPQTVNETAVIVSRLPRPPPQALPTPTVSSTVEVHGLKPILKANILKSFFSNPKKSEGGPIESLDIYQERGMAMITFCTSEDAVRVAETGIFTLGGCELVVQMTQMTMEKSDKLNSSDMSNSMSSNDTSSLDVRQGANTEPQRSLGVQSVPVKQPPQSCQDRSQYLPAQSHANTGSFQESNHRTNCTDERLLAEMSKLSLGGEQQSFNTAKSYAQHKEVEVVNPESYVRPLMGPDDSVAREHHGVSPPRIMGGGSEKDHSFQTTSHNAEKDHSFQTTSHNAEQRSFSSPQSAPQKMISKKKKVPTATLR